MTDLERKYLEEITGCLDILSEDMCDLEILYARNRGQLNIDTSPDASE